MSKVSSKLAAGVRKVKAQQKPAPQASEPVQSKAVKPVAKANRGEQGAALHPDRIWPD